MADAARLRDWRADNFARQQADRLNAVPKETERGNAKKAGAAVEHQQEFAPPSGATRRAATEASRPGGRGWGVKGLR